MIPPGFCLGRASTYCLARDGSGAGLSQIQESPAYIGLGDELYLPQLLLPPVSLAPQACFTENHGPHIRIWREGRRHTCAQTAVVKQPSATSVASEWGPEPGPSGDRAGAGWRGCTALQRPPSSLPRAECLMGKGIPRAPSTSLRPSSLRQLPALPSALCLKDDFSITATLVPLVILLPLGPSLPPATALAEVKLAQGLWHRVWGAGSCLQQRQEHTSKMSKQSRTLGSTFFNTPKRHGAQGRTQPRQPGASQPLLPSACSSSRGRSRGMAL